MDNLISFCERKKRRESEELVNKLCLASAYGDLDQVLDALEDILSDKKPLSGDAALVCSFRTKRSY